MRVEKLAWTHDDDIQLVETILRNVRQGKTVIDGCREYAESTNGVRSVDSSKFRFHTQLKDKYVDAYKIAREAGRKIKHERRKHVTQEERIEKVYNEILTDGDEKEVELADIMVLFKRYAKQEAKPKMDTKIISENEKLRKENEALKDSNIKLVKAFEEMEHDYKAIKQAVTVLKNVGLNIDIPTPTSTDKYKINKDGTVEPM